MGSLSFDVPLFIQVSKNKKFILNMNNYRNAHYRVLTKAKKDFTQIIKEKRLPVKMGRCFTTPIRLHYTLYRADKRKYDTLNVISVIDKFLMDALVDCGLIIDDTYDLVLLPTCQHGGIDRDNPRCEVVIEENATHYPAPS